VPTAPADHSAGALTSPLAVREARVAPHRGGLLATHARDDGAWAPQARLAGDHGQTQAEPGVRCLTEPRLLASSLDRKQPPRRMALSMVLTGWLLGYAALEPRLRPPLRAPAATFPDHQGPPLPKPTARGVFPCCVGIPRRLIPGQWPRVRNLLATHAPRLQLLGPPEQAFYA
jgi:hypothetical protein